MKAPAGKSVKSSDTNGKKKGGASTSPARNKGAAKESSNCMPEAAPINKGLKARSKSPAPQPPKANKKADADPVKAVQKKAPRGKSAVSDVDMASDPEESKSAQKGKRTPSKPAKKAGHQSEMSKQIFTKLNFLIKVAPRRRSPRSARRTSPRPLRSPQRKAKLKTMASNSLTKPSLLTSSSAMRSFRRSSRRPGASTSKLLRLLEIGGTPSLRSRRLPTSRSRLRTRSGKKSVY